jgi:predicted alpha/beta superfamily hydrolase
MRLCVVALLIIQITATKAQQSRSEQPFASERSDIVLQDAHLFMLRDPKTGVPYRIYVALPSDYGTANKKYPVLYVLDADASFAMLTQAYRLLRVDSNTPDIVLVGIGYDLAAAARRARRLRDLTPTRTAAESAAGEGARFLAYIAETLIPTIEVRYGTEATDRAIFGHSLGGLFALYALFERPEIFRRYIASSPSLWWDNAVLLRFESRFSNGRTSLPKSVFMSVGSEEPSDMREYFQPFADQLRSRKYDELKFVSTVLPDETHLTAPSAAFLRGLRTLYR